MISKEDFEQINFHVLIAKIDGTEFIFQRPLGIPGINGGTHADKLGHPVLLVEGKIHKVKDFEDAVNMANKF